MAGFDDFLSVLDESEFEEIPVDIDTFVSDPRFLGKLKFRLSPLQRECVLMESQIFRRETLESFLSPEDAQKRWAQTKNEIILKLGKGSGKDWMSAVAVAYVVYQLLCLRDPAEYYGNAAGDQIAIINIAINAKQAEKVFFTNIKRMFTTAEWFQGKYDAKPDGNPAQSGEFNFIKGVSVYSGHSEREAWEGYNVFMVILDEIAGFALESVSPTGKTAAAIYDMYRGSVVSRFAEFGKYVSLSFPRYKGDFITQKYDEVIAAKQVVARKETMKIDPELPDGIEGNEIVIEWDEDHIDAYKYRKTYALCRPPWDINPIKNLDMYVSEFAANYVDALSRFACMPPEAIDAFFKDRNKIEDAFSQPNGVNNEDGTFYWDLKPHPEVQYFVHVDLAQKHDRCAVALAHVEKWVRPQMAGVEMDIAPVVKVDLVRYWEPTKQQEVNFQEVQDFIISLRTFGFNLRLVTFDQWRSEDMRKYLSNIGIKTDLLSIKTEQYVDFAVVMNNGRLIGPKETKLQEELLGLRLFPNGKIDHPRQGYKDLSDATCGAIFNAVKLTPRNRNTEIEPMTYSDIRKAERNKVEQPKGVIKAPSVRSKIPPEMQAYLESMRII